MSLGEICVIIIVAIFIMKPADIPIIIEKIKYIKKYFAQIKTMVLSYFYKELQCDDTKLHEEVNEINSYIKKIVSLGKSYDGNYSLKDVRDKYQAIIKQKIEDKKL